MRYYWYIYIYTYIYIYIYISQLTIGKCGTCDTSYQDMDPMRRLWHRPRNQGHFLVEWQNWWRIASAKRYPHAAELGSFCISQQPKRLCELFSPCGPCVLANLASFCAKLEACSSSLASLRSRAASRKDRPAEAAAAACCFLQLHMLLHAIGVRPFVHVAVCGLILQLRAPVEALGWPV